MHSPVEYRHLSEWLSSRCRPLLVSHRRPDGDALGSLASLALALRQRGAAPRVMLFDPLPARYGLLKDAVAWEPWEAAGAAALRSADALVVLDTCALAQLEPLAPHLPDAPPTLVIDHHATADPIATRGGDLRVIDAAAGACCLLLAEWLLHEEQHHPISPDAARALLIGVLTDSGWLRFSNTDERMLRTAGALVSRGARPDELYEGLYATEPVERLRLAGRMLEQLRVLEDGQLIVLTLRSADFAAVGATPKMTEDLVNEASRAAGVTATLLFIEDAEGVVRVNFRSKHTLDVAALAREFGGGGHVRAAGARVAGEWHEVVASVTAAAQRALQSVKV